MTTRMMVSWSASSSAPLWSSAAIRMEIACRMAEFWPKHRSTLATSQQAWSRKRTINNFSSNPSRYVCQKDRQHWCPDEALTPAMDSPAEARALQRQKGPEGSGVPSYIFSRSLRSDFTFPLPKALQNQPSALPLDRIPSSSMFVPSLRALSALAAEIQGTKESLQMISERIAGISKIRRSYFSRTSKMIMSPRFLLFIPMQHPPIPSILKALTSSLVATHSSRYSVVHWHS